MIACPHCHTIQGPETVNTGRAASCPGCRSLLRIDLFNAFWANDGQGAGNLGAAAQGRAECFHHPGQLAVAPCADCGRLLCEVCQVALEGRTICMACLQAGRDKRKIGALQQRYLRRDEIALHLAFWPALMVFPTLLTAPAALFFAVRHWRTPSPVLPKGHWRAVTASVLAGAQLVAWIVLLILYIGG
ncbi:hypothetical protein [Desulfatitalea alkaliphila]|uniref:B box-type domain-containing protein n=1 Tax=Desulfatitalea alkaliphila TaxID=2929485 RepID=A0AA41R7Y9_9BACT|nr:hypothetical protein [Desulfatitalea alkaliphila]MCJ8502675.1 hypothetical protein [Desulfatitalea alkaliphila]